MGSTSISELFEPTSRVRYFSLARWALLAGLRLARVGQGDAVLLPRYICNEVLASVASCGAEVLFYDIDTSLMPTGAPADWPAAKAVIAVNYFGFPQPIDPFRDYCDLHGAVLIEDNAHGLLGRDENETYLGLRGDIGIFSMRKTLRLRDGAALVAVRKDLAEALPVQLLDNVVSPSLSFELEVALSRMPSPLPLAWAKAVRRAIRKWNTGSELPISDPSAEFLIPGNSAPHSGLKAALGKVDGTAVSARRRHLFDVTHRRLAQFGVNPVIVQLKSGVVPYGYAFRGGDHVEAARAARRAGHDVFLWPSLPSAVRSFAPEHYSNTWLVNFL